jgi:hypothetical protein
MAEHRGNLSMCYYTHSTHGLPPGARNRLLHRLITCQTGLDLLRAEPETAHGLTFRGDRPQTRCLVSSYATALNGISHCSLGCALPADTVADAVGTGGGGRQSNPRSVVYQIKTSQKVTQWRQMADSIITYPNQLQLLCIRWLESLHLTLTNLCRKCQPGREQEIN